MKYIIAARYNERGEQVADGEAMTLDCQAARDILFRLNRKTVDCNGYQREAEEDSRADWK